MAQDMDRIMAKFQFLVAVNEAKDRDGLSARNNYCLFCKASTPERFDSCEVCCQDYLTYLGLLAEKSVNDQAKQSALILTKEMSQFLADYE